MRVLVLGGRGFIGRHAVAALRCEGCDVVIGSRRATGSRRGAPAVRQARFESLVAPDAWLPVLAGVDTVVNCVGILRERRGGGVARESYEAIHHRAPAALAAACVAAGIGKLIHVSALGLAATSSNGFLVSKRAGEGALPRPGLDVTIVRPSLLDGPDGFGARWMRRLARLPLHLVPAGAVGRIAALDVDDLGLAIARLCAAPVVDGVREVELGGTEARTFAEYLQALRLVRAPTRATTVRVPQALARLAARLCDALHFSPYSAGHLELLGRDNVPRSNALAGLLGRPPKAIGASAGRRPCRPSSGATALAPDRR